VVACILKHDMPDLGIIMFTMYSDNVSKALSCASGVDAVLFQGPMECPTS
jgi:hypothetical protein